MDIGATPYGAKPYGADMRLREAMRLPWSAVLPETWIEAVHSSVMTDRAPRLRRAPVRLRVMPWEDVIILAGDPVYRSREPALLLRLSPDGALKGSVGIAPPDADCERWQIDDFLIDESGTAYLLETARRPSGLCNYLRSLAPTGKPNWKRSGPVAAESFDLLHLEGTYRQLLINGRSTPFLSATRHRGLVASIDASNGALEPYADWGEWTGEVFMDGGGRLYFVRYLPESRQRGWACFDPHSRLETMTPGDDSLYGLYDIPIGVDDRGRAYTVMVGRIACIDGQANLLWQDSLDNLIVDTDSASVYASTCRAEGESVSVQVRAWGAGAGLAGGVALPVPDSLAAGSKSMWSVIRLDEQKRYWVYGGETVHQDGALLVYSPRGLLETVTKPAPALHTMEHRLQWGRTWCVGLGGSIYLPVAGPAGFHLIELNTKE